MPVNNVGSTLIGALADFCDEQIEGMLRANLIGPDMLTRH